VVLAVYGGLVVLTWWGFTRLPTGYIPVQTSPRCSIAVQLPDAASQERSQEIVDRIAQIAQESPAWPTPRPSPGSRSRSAPTGSNFGTCSSRWTSSRSAAAPT